MQTSTTPQDRETIIARLLKGAVDLHCHSGPSVMPRDLDHVEAMEEAAKAGMKAILIKDHYYSATPITAMLNTRFAHLNVIAYSGVPLNNTTGNFNKYAVDHGIKLGARIVWMPTFNSANHIAHHNHQEHFNPKSTAIKHAPLAPEPLTVLDAQGKLKDEVKVILDLIAQNDLVLSGGHLHISEIFKVFEEAKARGVKRLLCNHPTFVVDATMEDIGALSRMGVYVEHSICMWTEKSIFKFYEPDFLDQLIKAAGVERTILGSDLGQQNNPHPVVGFRGVIAMCLDLGYSEADIRKMIADNPSALVGIP